MLLPAALSLLLIPVRSQTADSNATANNPAHPTLAEFREASYTFFSRMRDAGYGQTSAVVFGAASIKNHFPDFRSTPVSPSIRPSGFPPLAHLAHTQS